MSTYNFLTAELMCSHCKSKSDVEISCYFGDISEMKSYRIGDVYEWKLRKAVQNGGCSPNSSLQGEGYAECPKCNRDFFVAVHIVDGKISKAEPDSERLPYGHDEVLYDQRLSCPVCQKVSVAEVHLFRDYAFGRVFLDCNCEAEFYVVLREAHGSETVTEITPQGATFVFTTNVVRNK